MGIVLQISPSIRGAGDRERRRGQVGSIDMITRGGGEWAAGWRATPARRSGGGGGGRLHLKVCCFVAAALMCNRTNKDEALGPTQERKSAPDAPPSAQNRLLGVNRRLF